MKTCRRASNPRRNQAKHYESRKLLEILDLFRKKQAGHLPLLHPLGFRCTYSNLELFRTQILMFRAKPNGT